MRKWLLAAGLVYLCGAAYADGMGVPSSAAWDRYREKAYINEPQQKAMVQLRNGMEDLVISPSFSGNAADFAWIIPVPRRPRVEIVKGALFHELARLVAPRPRSQGMAGLGRSKGLEPAAAPDSVTVLERKPVGAYDVTVLKATDSGALMRWLKVNKYHLPAAAGKPIAAYIKEHWTFVACRVRLPKAARGLAAGTLAPLKLTFPSSRLVYPMRLSSANPMPFDVLVYVVSTVRQTVACVAAPSEQRSLFARSTVAGRVGAPRTTGGRPAARFLRIPPVNVKAWPQENPTIAGLTGSRYLRVSAWGHRYIHPAACSADFVWVVQ